jgi:hypothetical protein
LVEDDGSVDIDTTMEEEPASSPDAPGTAAGATGAVARPHTGPIWTGRASLEAAFADVEDRDEIPARVFSYLRHRFQRLVLFTVRNQQLTGWDASGPRLRRQVVEPIAASLTPPSLFQSVAHYGNPFVGALPFGDVEESLLVKLGSGEWPEHLVIWPIRVRGRTVAMLYAEAESSAAARGARDAIEDVIACVEQTFIRLIMQRKQARGA